MPSRERDYDASRKKEQRAADRDIVIEPVANPERRLRAETDPLIALETYFENRFYDPFTESHKLQISEIQYRSEHGGDKAIAAARGDGKTSFAECWVGIGSIVTGLLRFPVIIGANGPAAKQILENIKTEYETNELLIADYPEVCGPIVALDGAPQRAKMQTCNGERTRMTWSTDKVVFPTVRLRWCPKCYYPEPRERSGCLECPKCHHQYKTWLSKASGAIIQTRGLDGAIRGIRHGSIRPDFAMIDDAETEESARSYTQIKARERKIDRDIAGLGTSRKPIARLMLCTIQNTMCLAAKYTDRKLKPSWDGVRLPLVVRWPDRKDLWEEYIEKRQTGMQEEPPDKEGRAAHQFYLDNREEMDKGCAVSNPNRYNPEILDDGTQAEVSTIEYVHNEAADNGWDYVFCELQNAPQDDETEDLLQLSVGIVTGTHSAYSGRLCGVPHGTAPADTKRIVAFVDVQHDRLYFQVRAFQGGMRSTVVDYGDYGAEIGRNMTVSDATVQRLVSLAGMFKEMPYEVEHGETRQPELTLVDSGDGNTQGGVYTACLATGFLPSKGDLKLKKPASDEINQGPDPWKSTYITHQGKGLWLFVFSTEPFRHRCRDSWLIEPTETQSGSVYLCGDNPAYHRNFGEHMSVVFDRRYEDGKGWIEEWIEPRRHDHWDCSYGVLVAHSVLLQVEALRKRGRRKKYGVLSRKQ